MWNALVPLVAVLVPLIITPGLLFYFDITPKVAVFLTGVSLLLLFRPGILIKTQVGHWFAILIAVQWALLCLATAFSTHPVLSINGTTWRRSGLIVQTGVLVFALISAAWLARNPAHVRLLLRAWTSAGAVISIYAIAQYFGLDPLLPATAYQAGEGPFTIVRTPGTLGHADYLAAWLLTVVFCGFALASLDDQPFWKKLAFVTSLLASLAIVLSGTRSALLGLLVGGMLWLALQRPRFSGRRLTEAGLCAAALAILFFSPAGAKMRARVHWSTDDPRGGARALLWRDSLRVVAAHPITGLGLETFGTEFPRYESLDLARAYPDFYHESPHNIFLDLAASQGIPPLIVFLMLCGLALWSGYLASSPGRGALLAAFLALLVSQQFMVFTLPTEIAFYLLAALLIALAGTADSVPEPGAAFAVARFALASLFLLFAVRSVVGDYWMSAASTRLQAGDGRGAADAYHRSIWWQPSGTGADLAYSRQAATLAAGSPNFRTRLESFQQAVEAGIRATKEGDDRQNAWYSLAQLLASQNDPAGVERSLRNAILWAPNWFKPHWALAQLLDGSHRPGEAVQEAAAALDRDGGHDAEVSATWAKISRNSLNSR